MRYKSRKWKKSLTNLQHTRVLEIIGLSTKPLSSTQIHHEYVKKYPHVNPNSNVYEIVKDLYNPHQNKKQQIPIKFPFLSIDYKEKYEKEIALLRERLGLNKTDNHDYYYNTDVKVITFKNSNEEMDRTNAILKIGNMMKDKKYYRYSLKFRGFLLYLIGSYEHYIEIDNNQINKNKRQKIIKTIYDIIKNVTSRDDIKDEFEFLQCLKVFDEIYGEKKIVELLIQIAEELRYQLIILIPEFMKYYLLRRCYEDVLSDIAFRDWDPSKSLILDESLGQWRQKNNDEKQKDHEDYSRLKQAKKEILKTLIPMQEQQLEKMKEDLKNTDDDQETIQLQTSENYMNKI